MSSRAKIDMSLGSPLRMKMREALWSAVACYRFRSGQLAGRGRVYRAFGERGREQARGIKAPASCRTPQRLRRLTSVFSIEASSIFMAARDLLLVCFLRCSPFFGQKIVLLKMDRRRRACGNCEKAERSWRGLFQASVGIRVLCGFPSEASVSTGLGFSFFFAPFFFLGVFHKKILPQDRLGTTIAPSVDL